MLVYDDSEHSFRFEANFSEIASRVGNGGDLQSTETVLRPGDVVVQRGTSPRWENRSTQPARMAFILVDGAFTAGLRAALGEVTLLHDPL